MASSYRVNWSIGEGTDPTLPGKDAIIVPDGMVDSTSTSISLTGRNIPVYGEIQQENFVRLMENFANTTPPVQATVGQTWFDSDHANGNGTLGALKIYRKSYPAANPLLSSTNETTPPTVAWHLVNNPVEVMGYRPVDATGLAGDAMAGPLVLPAMPTLPLQAATKSYVDAVASGLSVRDHVAAATTATLNATYTSGSADASGGLGVGAKLTSNVNSPFVTDVYTAILNDRILVKNQSNPIQNGIYDVTTLGTIGTPWQLTRSTDYDNHIAGQVAYGDYIFIGHGSTWAGTGWVETQSGTAGGDVIKIGTDAIQFSQYSAAGVSTAGPGISITGPLITNIGVRSVVAGTNISVSAPTGDSVTIGVTGTVANAAQSVNSTNAANVAVALDNTSATFYPTFSPSTSGNVALKVDSDLTYNPSTNTLSVANFAGALSGNATTATSATTATRLAGGVLGSLPYQLSAGNTTFLGIGSNGSVLTVSGGVPTWGAPAGTVSSVGLSAPSIFSVSGSPVTSAGTLTLSLASQTANTFFAAPNGSAGTPSFRGIAAADVPTLNQNTSGSAGSAGVASTLSINSAGTGTFNYSGQAGQPSWLWGTNDGVNMYVWNPSNFSVASATSATNSTNASFSSTQSVGTNNTSIATTAFVQAQLAAAGIGSGSSSFTNPGYAILPGGLVMQWGSFSSVDGATGPGAPSKTVFFPLTFPNACLNVTTSQPYPVSYGYTLSVASFTTSSVSFWSSHTVGATVYWLALGY